MIVSPVYSTRPRQHFISRFEELAMEVDHSSSRLKRSRSRSPPPWRRPNKMAKTLEDGSPGQRDKPSDSASHNAPSQRAPQDQARLNQIQEDERMREWVAQEDTFVLKQAKKKAQIRVKDGRAKPIDWLAVTLRAVDPTLNPLDDEIEEELDVMDPQSVFEGLSSTQLYELEKDIDTYLSLETNARNRDYWRTMRVLCKDKIKQTAVTGPEDRAVSSVSSDIDRLLGPMSYEELERLQQQIDKKLDSNEPIDTDYWQQLLQNLLVWKARAKAKDVYQLVMKSRAESSRNLGSEERDAGREILRKAAPEKSSAPSDNPIAATSMAPEQNASSVKAPRSAASTTDDPSHTTKALYDREVARGVTEDEEIFTGEEEIDTKSKSTWTGKYRPRKPRYFNRVQMGYEWNKYNQTHYDHDNPPPKVVQGYKFNIFYPELIDKTKAPTYKIQREGGRKKGQSFAPAGEEDTCVIRFISGPPYEDVAFRIVDKEWDYSAKRDRGFKSSFDKGILTLSFQFKKIFYRK